MLWTQIIESQPKESDTYQNAFVLDNKDNEKPRCWDTKKNEHIYEHNKIQSYFHFLMLSLYFKSWSFSSTVFIALLLVYNYKLVFSWVQHWLNDSIHHLILFVPRV